MRYVYMAKTPANVLIPIVRPSEVFAQCMCLMFINKKHVQ